MLEVFPQPWSAGGSPENSVSDVNVSQWFKVPSKNCHHYHYPPQSVSPRAGTLGETDSMLGGGCCFMEQMRGLWDWRATVHTVKLAAVVLWQHRPSGRSKNWESIKKHLAGPWKKHQGLENKLENTAAIGYGSRSHMGPKMLTTCGGAASAEQVL